MTRPTTQNPCTRCGTPCRAEKGICRPCRLANAKRRWRRCPGCGATTTSKSGTCCSCRTGYADTPVTQEHALTGGTWRRQGLVYVWEPAAEQVDDEQADAA